MISSVPLMPSLRARVLLRRVMLTMFLMRGSSMISTLPPSGYGSFELHDCSTFYPSSGYRIDL